MLQAFYPHRSLYIYKLFISISDSVGAVLVITILADDVPEVDETFVVRLESIEPSDSQQLRPGSREVYITILANGNPGGVFQFASFMSSSYVIQVGILAFLLACIIFYNYICLPKY